MRLSSQDLAQIEALLGRKPSHVECYIFDTMWSEHCSYKSSKEILKKYLPTQGSEVLLGIGEDSGIIKLTEQDGKTYGIAISHESHNHPSQILPIEGAATGVGGVVRDVYCMGADVIGVLNSLHFGINQDQKTPLVDDIAKDVVRGVSDYANPLGVPVLGGETLYHTCYNDNCLVNVAALGLVEASKIIRSRVPEEAKTQTYDMILIGKSTDATGFGGASFSSATLDKENESLNIGAVQIHDPFLKRVIVEALKALFELIHSQQVPVGFKDLGAGGISCATSELAAASGYGVTVDLDKVNVAFPNLNPEVIACSETQERFCIAVPQSFTPQVLRLFNDTFALGDMYPHAGAVVIGQVSTTPSYKLVYKGEVVCDLPIQAITSEVRAYRESEFRPILRQAPEAPEMPTEQLEEKALALLSSPNCCSKRYVYRFFDNAVRGDTVVYPGEADATVVTPVPNSPVGVVTSIDSNLYGYHDPYTSGAYAVAESVRNLICMGARPLCITDCLNYGNPEKPSVFFDFEEGVKGIADAAKNFGFIEGEPLPVISGNVSFYNDSKDGNAVVPSPVIVAVGKVEDYRNALVQQVMSPELTLILVGDRKPEFGGTQIATLVDGLTACAPQVDFKAEHAEHQAVYTCVQNGWVSACHDISAGGLWVTLCEMLLGERSLYKVGATVALPVATDPFTALFSENGGFVLAVSKDHLAEVKAALASVVHMEIGHTTEAQGLGIEWQGKRLFTLSLETLRDQWEIRNPK